MTDWHPQQYRASGLEINVDPDVLENSVLTGTEIVRVDPKLQPVLTLRHLAYLTNVDYGFLRSIVSRSVADPYRTFSIRKSLSIPKTENFRVISIPDPALMRVQRWIAHRILSRGRPHWASYAYAPKSNFLAAARMHCECKWMMKLDVKRFFESISEIAAYRAFRSLGYQPLVSFELARICTRVRRTKVPVSKTRWFGLQLAEYKIGAYHNSALGYLPQGAPTSPMLSNIAVATFDDRVMKIAESYSLVYTRYADDICLSTKRSDFDRSQATTLIGKIYAEMGRIGLSPNLTKTQVLPPGARKIMLGLLVDGKIPRPTREFRACLRQHIYFLTHPDIGPARHAGRRQFASVMGLRNHVYGLISYARMIDPAFADQCETA
jgi:RNA-directed DNA polymerase